MKSRKVVWREFRGLQRALGRGHFPLRDSRASADGPGVFILGGYIPNTAAVMELLDEHVAWPWNSLAGYVARLKQVTPVDLYRWYYRGLRNHLVRMGYQAVITQTEISTSAYERNADRLLDEASKVFGEGVQFDVVGHSLGGAYGIHLKIHHPDRVGRVVTLGTPTLGTPVPELRRLVVEATGVSEELYRKYRKEILSHSDDITMISGIHDGVAPPARCRIGGTRGKPTRATHIDVAELFPESTITHAEIATDPKVLELVGKVLDEVPV